MMEVDMMTFNERHVHISVQKHIKGSSRPIVHLLKFTSSI